jgi:hypothetical protein
MKLADPTLGHLTYCTNIHAAEHWADMRSGLQRHLPDIKAGFSPQQPLGVGLRVSASAAQSLQNPDTLAELKSLLGEDYYVFTINGFPYGTFHGEKVKENAYMPDWSTPERLDYTNLLAQLLAELLPEGLDGSISTVPGTFKPWAEAQPERVDVIARNLITHTAKLVGIHQSTGKTIMLALEPEPYCLIETIAETVDFFQHRLFSDAAVRQLSESTGLDGSAAQDALRRHLGVCYDVCHAAVEFEDPRTSIQALNDAGIAIGKLQLSSALRIAEVDAQSEAQLRPFDEPVYLHQVVQNRNGQLAHFVDLDEALAQIDDAAGAEWRVHFHVPIFLAEMKDFATTQNFLSEILKLHREQPISPHLEVETYTWDVLPDHYRNVGIGAAIARELNWVRDQLA